MFTNFEIVELLENPDRHLRGKFVLASDGEYFGTFDTITEATERIEDAVKGDVLLVDGESSQMERRFTVMLVDRLPLSEE